VAGHFLPVQCDDIPRLVGEVQQIVVIAAVKILAVLFIGHGQTGLTETMKYPFFFMFLLLYT